MFFVMAIILLIVGVLPSRDVLVISSKKYLINCFITALFIQVCFLITYLFFINDENQLTILLYIHCAITVVFKFSEYIIADSIYMKIIRKRILELGYFQQLTIGQIRNALIERYNEAYSIKDVERALKKLEY